MIERVKRIVRRHWPRLRLRTILLLTFTFVAALPGVGALFLRVYENALVRQTEAALVAQGAALAAAAAVEWQPGQPIASSSLPVAEAPSIDLRLTPILPDRPAPHPGTRIEDRRMLAWAERVAPVVRLTGRATGAAILVLDRRGNILVGLTGRGNHADLPEVRMALAGHAATTVRRNRSHRPAYIGEWLSRAADLCIHHTRPIVVDGRIVGVILLSQPPRALFAGLDADRGKIAIGILLIFMTLVILSGLLSRGIVRPVEALGAATRIVASGGGTVPDAPTTAAIEIQALYRDFGSMAEAIEHRSRYLRDFAHAVSHEFKTPLSGIGGAVELLQDHPDMGVVDRERFLTNIASDAARLTLLVSRLLDLARADMAAAMGGGTCDVADVAKQVADADTRRGFTVTLRLPPDLPAVAVPAAAIASVLSCLIENSGQAGASHLTIDGRHHGRSIALTVSDDGPGIPPGDRARVFEPFFTSRRTTGGTGLGLPIARSLLAAHRGTITLLGNGKDGAVFRITLPVQTDD
ncbi:sensor histidine kinase [Sphingomonas sp. CFBP 8760]|uniref:sensor histidine kinase n=1 Tax=Sphingomonas sp. CFBP 8760 TaxID=2775282 RepID=UPI001782E566|nr:HAMP domain-containing sensor histidine kinase [Sphingomonas sp. CFBP 8760]MBD8547875.1 HAMP domain-containing histidine kinase [Sphingomonas sp. CFBP 8760]